MQYQFADPEDHGVWRLAEVAPDSLMNYRDVKFKLWDQTLSKPTCEAEFRRILQNGVVTNIFDPAIFETPEALKKNYEVTDTKTGKLLKCPHPVGALRIWDAATGAYTAVDPHLKGAPTAGEAAAWFENIANLYQNRIKIKFSSKSQTLNLRKKVGEPPTTAQGRARA